MSQDPQFQARFEAEVQLFIQETMDGCVDCLALGDDAPCHAHDTVFLDLILHPRKYIKIRRKKGEQK